MDVENVAVTRLRSWTSALSFGLPHNRAPWPVAVRLETALSHGGRRLRIRRDDLEATRSIQAGEVLRDLQDSLLRDVICSPEAVNVHAVTG